jgi:hypothetical protein
MRVVSGFFKALPEEFYFGQAFQDFFIKVEGR